MKMSVLRFVKITLRNPVESRRNLTQWFYCSQMLLACLSGVSQEKKQGEQQRFLKVRNTHRYYVAKLGILLEDTPWSALRSSSPFVDWIVVGCIVSVAWQQGPRGGAEAGRQAGRRRERAAQILNTLCRRRRRCWEEAMPVLRKMKSIWIPVSWWHNTPTFCTSGGENKRKVTKYPDVDVGFGVKVSDRKGKAQ